ncbi:unnamed protein product [Calypogeia fissa]
MQGSIHDQSVHPKFTGKGDRTSITTCEDHGRAAAAKSVNNKNKIFAVAKAGERAKKLVPKDLTKVREKASKSLKPPHNSVEPSNDLGNTIEGARVMSRSTKECQPPDTTTHTAEESINGFVNESASTDRKKWGRSRLQFPEKLSNLLAWFTSRGISLEDPVNVPRAEAHAAKEDFLCALDEVNNQQDGLDDKAGAPNITSP